jgi:phosphotransferase system enzyme I (PtsI)
MCGEAACDPLLIPLLISFGLNEYSVSATSILETRKAIAGWTKQEADLIADKVMRMNSAAEIKKFLYVNRK